ncbi:hypothetical protein ACUY4R_003214 [Kosakonia sp. BK9b]
MPGTGMLSLKHRGSMPLRTGHYISATINKLLILLVIFGCI